MTPDELLAVWLDRRRELFGIARRYSAWSEAEDVVQEVYIRSLENIDKIRPAEARFWMCALARNLAVDKLRRATRIRLIDQVELGRADDGGEGASSWVDTVPDERADWEQRKVDDADRLDKIIALAGNSLDVQAAVAKGSARILNQPESHQRGQHGRGNYYEAEGARLGIKPATLKSRYRRGIARLRWAAMMLGELTREQADALGTFDEARRQRKRRVA